MAEKAGEGGVMVASMCVSYHCVRDNQSSVAALPFVVKIPWISQENLSFKLGYRSPMIRDGITGMTFVRPVWGEMCCIIIGAYIIKS